MLMLWQSNQKLTIKSMKCSQHHQKSSRHRKHRIQSPLSAWNHLCKPQKSSALKFRGLSKWLRLSASQRTLQKDPEKLPLFTRDSPEHPTMFLRENAETNSKVNSTTLETVYQNLVVIRRFQKLSFWRRPLIILIRLKLRRALWNRRFNDRKNCSKIYEDDWPRFCMEIIQAKQ